MVVVVVVLVVVVVVGGGGGRRGGVGGGGGAARAHPASPPPASASRPFVCCRRVRTRTHTHPDRTPNQVPRPLLAAPNNRRGIQRRQMISDGQLTGRGSRVSRVVGFRKDAQESCFGRPQVDQNDGEVRTGAVVDVPKGTVVVGDRRRAPGRSMGANGGGLARRRFHRGAGAESLKCFACTKK